MLHSAPFLALYNLSLSLQLSILDTNICLLLAEADSVPPSHWLLMSPPHIKLTQPPAPPPPGLYLSFLLRDFVTGRGGGGGTNNRETISNITDERGRAKWVRHLGAFVKKIEFSNISSFSALNIRVSLKN